MRLSLLIAAAVVASLSGCAAGGRSAEPARAVAPATLRGAVDARWAGPLDTDRTVALFQTVCLAFAPGFESARAFDAAGFRNAGVGAPREPGDVFFAARPDGATARLARRGVGSEAPVRSCEIALAPDGPAPEALSPRIAPAIRAVLPEAELIEGASAFWQVTDGALELEMTVRVARVAGRTVLAARATE